VAAASPTPNKRQRSKTLSAEGNQDPPLLDELKQFGDEARSYAEAEIAFQKARAVIVGRNIRSIALASITALIVAIFALVALVAGLLMGLSSLVGPWWATAIVAGGLILVVLGAVMVARAGVSRIARLFSSGDQT